MTRKIECTIQGISPLLMRAHPLEEITGIDKRPPLEQAESAAYRIPDTRELYVPAPNLQRCLVSAAAYSKGKGRASLVKVVAACVFVSPEWIGLGKQTFDIDSRWVVIKATGGRVMRHRPRFNAWKLTFTIEYDEAMLSEKQVRCVVDDAGQRVGILDFRPECKGPFGRFMVIGWE